MIEKYKEGKVIISIGCFSKDSLSEWQAHTRCLIVDYEATLELYKDKKELEKLNPTSMGKLECHNEAVSDKNGKAQLIYYKDGNIGNSICHTWREGINEDDIYDKIVTIPMISMADVLNRFSEVKELWLNCEGSEIPILMNTPLELLKRCEYISCEFHRFSSFLKITNGQIKTCIERLKEIFEPVLGEDYHPYYEFFRR